MTASERFMIMGVVTVLGAADEAPALGCGGSLVTNDVSGHARTNRTGE